MPESSLILGLSDEERESALHQVRLWDGMTVGTELRRELLRRPRQSKYADAIPGEFKRFLMDDGRWTEQFTGRLDPQAMKLCRLLNHLNMRIKEPPDPGALHAAGLKIEREAIAAVSRREQKRRDARKDGKPDLGPVKTTGDLVRHVLCRLFTDLEERLSKASPSEQERFAKEIADALGHMDGDVREQVRRIANLDDLTMQTLLRSGALGALGVGLAGVVGTAGFAAYTTLNATIAAIGGLAGLTLPFSVYVGATSLLAFVSNPLVVTAVVAGGGAWLVKLANRRLQAELLPLLVAFACAKAEPGADARGRVRDLAQHLSDRYYEFLHASPEDRKQLHRAFPAFDPPKEYTRAA